MCEKSHYWGGTGLTGVHRGKKKKKHPESSTVNNAQT